MVWEKEISTVIVFICVISFLPLPVYPIDQSNFGNGQDAWNVVFNKAGINSSAFISIPDNATVLQAGMRISGASYNNEYPLDPCLRVGEGGEWNWRYFGTGYGAMGQQTMFSDGAGGRWFENGEQAYFQLPRNATVTSAHFNVTGVPSYPFKAYTCIDDVFSIEVDKKTGEVWYGTDGGLVRWNESLGTKVFTVADGLPDNLVTQVAISDRYVFARTSRGACVVSRESERPVPVWDDFPGRNGVNDIAVQGETVFVANGCQISVFDCISGSFLRTVTLGNLTAACLTVSGEYLYALGTRPWTDPEKQNLPGPGQGQGGPYPVGVNLTLLRAPISDLSFTPLWKLSKGLTYMGGQGQGQGVAYVYLGNRVKTAHHMGAEGDCIFFSFGVDNLYSYHRNESSPAVQGLWEWNSSQAACRRISNCTGAFAVDASAIYCTGCLTSGDYNSTFEDEGVLCHYDRSGRFIQSWNVSTGLSTGQIRAIEMDRSTVYLGGSNMLWKGGVSRLRRAASSFDAPLLTTNGPVSNLISDLSTSGDRVYIATSEWYRSSRGGKGFSVFNEARGAFETPLAPSVGSLNDNIECMGIDADAIYFGGCYAPPGRYDISTGNFSPLTEEDYFPDVVKMVSDDYWVYLEITGGKGWVDLIRYSKANRTFADEPDFLKWNRSVEFPHLWYPPFPIAVGPDGFWISAELGIEEFDKNTGELRRNLTEEDGLPSRHATSLFCDGSTLLAGSEHGLGVYDAESSRLLCNISFGGPVRTVYADKELIYAATLEKVLVVKKGSFEILAILDLPPSHKNAPEWYYSSSYCARPISASEKYIYIGSSSGLLAYDRQLILSEKLNSSDRFPPAGISADIGGSGDPDWSIAGPLNGTVRSDDLSSAINEYLRTSDSNFTDDYGNEMCQVPIRIGYERGSVQLSDVVIKYDYSANVPDLAGDLNKYRIAHHADADVQGLIKVPVNLTCNSAGILKLSDLNLTRDEQAIFLLVEVGFSNAEPARGTLVYITAHIRNVGNIDMTGANITFYDSNESGSTPVQIGRDETSQALHVNAIASFTQLWNATPGKHTILAQVQAIDGYGRSSVWSSSRELLCSRELPMAIIDASILTVLTLVPVQFSSQRSYAPSGHIMSISWDFGDGTRSDSDGFHVFAKAGTYNVTLKVTDDDGQTGLASARINVLNRPPSASMLAPGNGTTGEEIVFDATTSFDADGRITGFIWNFSDGESAGGKVVGHIFQNPGTYSISLKVIDDDLGESSASWSIDILNATIPVTPRPPEPPRDTVTRTGAVGPSVLWLVVLLVLAIAAVIIFQFTGKKKRGPKRGPKRRPAS